MYQFPNKFLWGSATSSYQVEGGNSNADWWAWELKAGRERSLEACQHYSRYAEDFDLVKDLGHNAHRLSIEWSRVEPKEGEFSAEATAHYIDAVKALRARGIEPMVTLHHFTNPVWMSDSGGWTKRSSVDRFARFCNHIVRALAPHVHYWITINEPTVYFSHSFLYGNWPPQQRSLWATKLVRDNMARAHIKVYPLINAIYKKQGLPKPAISIAQHISAMVACTPTSRNLLAVRWRDHICNFEFLDELKRHNTLDYIGVNYYSRQKVDVSSWWIGNLLMETCSKDHDPRLKNSLGWDIYPEGLYQILMKLKRYDLPVIITENGICTRNDEDRWKFIRGHLNCVHQAMREGVSVEGYFYWSLMDNFEWAEGYRPRFGLVDIDYATQKRTVRGSARKFAELCKTGVLEG